MSGSQTRAARKLVLKRYRMAAKILAALQQEATQRQLEAVPIEYFQELARLHRLEQVARARNWTLAATRLRANLVSLLALVRESINLSLQAAGENGTKAFRCSAIDIIKDLAALDSDFDDVELDVKNRTVSVTTEPIELEGSYFGAFQIVLELAYLGNYQPYRVIAKDPQAAATNDSTTHPHVQSESLCEGDGHLPIKNALLEGRIHDFFTVVLQVLQNYNGSSAYITLDDWDGVECSACGGCVDHDESSSCSRCGDRSCNECSCTCNGCDDSFCDSCTTTCESCDTSFCNSCMNPCRGCDKPFCQDCLTENKCDDCLDKERETEAANDDEYSLDAAVLAVCVGEVSFHA